MGLKHISVGTSLMLYAVFRLAAEQGISTAQYNLGVRITTVKKFLKTSEKQSSGTARVRNKDIPQRNTIWGCRMTTVKESSRLQRSSKWYRKNAEQGYSRRNTIWGCRIVTVKESLRTKRSSQVVPQVRARVVEAQHNLECQYDDGQGPSPKSS